MAGTSKTTRKRAAGTVDGRGARIRGSDLSNFAHTGPGTLAGRYMRMVWQPIYEAELLPVGRARSIRVMSELFTFYRGQSGTVYLVGAHCPHRQTQLSLGWIEGEDIRCFYHGWMFNGAGQCVQQPAEPKPFTHKVRIPSYPTREYLGLIFAYLGEGEPPEFPRFPEFENADSSSLFVSPMRRTRITTTT